MEGVLADCRSVSISLDAEARDKFALRCRAGWFGRVRFGFWNFCCGGAGRAKLHGAEITGGARWGGKKLAGVRAKVHGRRRCAANYIGFVTQQYRRTPVFADRLPVRPVVGRLQ